MARTPNRAEPDIEVPSRDLELVETIEDIRESVQAFNESSHEHPELSRSLLTQTTYWVYDPDEQIFGPAKFAGFKVMTAADYMDAKEGWRSGARFDGHVTRTRIEEVSGQKYAPNAELAARLQRWAEAVYPSGPSESVVLAGVDQSKWLFVALLPSTSVSKDWSVDEVTAIVADYFAMLAEELRGERYNKTANRNALLKVLSNRSASAVEFKHCNISSVLRDMGLIHIDGYKPRANYPAPWADTNR